MSDERPSFYRRRPSLFWPILLIGAGVILLLSNLEMLPADPWPLLGQLWPVVLIIIGLDILLGRRSVLGGVLSAVLALLLVGGIVALLYVAQNHPALYDAWTPDLHSERISYPMAEVSQAEVTIEFPRGTGYIVALDDSTNLLEGDVRYYGELAYDVSVNGSTARVRLNSQQVSLGPRWWDNSQQRWAIGLNPDVTYDLALDTGSGEYDLDLGRFTLRSLSLDAGSGPVKLNLPETGQYRVQLEAGSGNIDITLPEGVAVQVKYEAGSGALNAPGLKQISGSRRDGTYESPGFSESSQYVVINLNGGSGAVTIR